MTSQQKSVFIYLFLRGESDGGRGGIDTFFLRAAESWQEKNKILENRRAAPPAGPSDSSSRVCAVLPCPHLRQTHMVLIHHMRTADSFTLSASPSHPEPFLSCLLIYPISPAFAPIPAPLTAAFLSLTIHISFSCPLPTSFLYSLTFLMKSFLPFVSPEHISYRCTCHPLRSRIFEIFSYRSIATVSLQDVLLTSHIPTALRESCQKHLPSPRT